jgi:multimeric flavodoxin WrbA
MILLVNGSPRKGNTYSVLEQMKCILERHDYETEIINIGSMNMKTCIGCYKCVLEGKEACPFATDDVASILKKMIAAEGIVLSSPVFALGMAGVFKNFIDRVAYNAHHPEMYNKPTIVVTTTAGMGTNYVIQQLKRLDVIGLKVVGSIGFLVYPIGSDKPQVRKQKERKMEKVIEKFERAMERKKEYTPTLIRVIQFYGLKLNSEFGKRAYVKDYELYKNRDFFTDAKVNPIKKGIGKMIYRIGIASLSKRISTEEE